jgi:flagellar hook-basal body complex protein FliE
VLFTPIEPRPQTPEVGAASFRGALGGLVSEVNAVQHEASDAINRFAAGDGENLHEVMIAVSKAELSFKFLMEARNKLVDAYHEVMRMQL